ncbi:aspartate aminotransferase family protein [Pseudoalteromonas obscura]|uniref:Aminotransferase class III-fold pyridoxal phosphate-dependent enzyme n=1 Tax=Pseudoalteromonas obscura TaxID=3048491 RepID=A0ABT7EQ93_9GAMM|nr:aminotransferase class III-fold pyridoxal phosphate-dependent enzyme [Pseudoalteromonas sp. P94(2023)]MDK2597236.1 aminotransferase class III-fold pyridoxal phosphate-dependent enzyme [Pseudoalteromonas sp. P94(2023)]
MREHILGLLKTHSNRSKARLSNLMNLPIEQSAQSAEILDEKGKVYLDFGGFGVFILGHKHPKVVEAVKSQIDVMPMSSRTLVSPNLATASKKLVDICPDAIQYAFFTNSGAESTELGLKLARANGCKHIIALTGSYHGKSLGALSVTHRDEFRAPFSPLFDNVEFVERDNIAALKSAFAKRSEPVAFIAEPVQGEGGVYALSYEFLHTAKQLCDQSGGLFICDEIQSGLARTGAMWAIDKHNIVPDVMLVGKGLSGGVVPCAAVVATEKAFAPLNQDFMLHSSTFGGSPIALAAAEATIDVLLSEQVAQRAARLGQQILDKLNDIVHAKNAQHEEQIIIRGEGLLIGIDVGTPARAGQLTLLLLNQNILTSHSLSNASTVRLTPCAFLTDDQLAQLYSAFTIAIEKI